MRCPYFIYFFSKFFNNLVGRFRRTLNLERCVTSTMTVLGDGNCRMFVKSFDTQGVLEKDTNLVPDDGPCPMS